MARIRSIKPEFPQSESMGNVSREARLAFVLLWTLADDEGRLRGNSRMLASLLFPYDDDAPSLIDGWLTELEEECCIERYKTDGASYVQICNWLIHQKIDKPSKSKLPQKEQPSRILANPRECSSEDLRIKDQGVDAPQAAGDQSPSAPATPENQECNSADEGQSPSRKRGTRLPEDWVLPKAWGEWALANRPGWGPEDVRLCADKFADYWRPKSGSSATKLDWLGTWRNWVRNDRTAPAGGSSRPASSSSIFAGML